MRMTRQQARDWVNGKPITDFQSLTRSKGGLYVCPLCGSGTGNNGKGTGALSIDKKTNRVCCFANNCFASADGKHQTQDTIGALRLLWGTDESGVFERIGLDVGASSAAEITEKKKPIKKKEPPKADFRAYIAGAQKALAESERAKKYLTGRGLTPETWARFMLGYDAKKDAIVIPYGKAGRYYITRSLTEKQYRKPPSSEAGAEPLYNGACLYSDAGAAVFVVESAFCAISIMQAGGQAVALNGTGANKLTEKIDAQPTQKTLLLCLDNDEAGKKAQAELAEHLRERGVPFIGYNVAGDQKDPNDALQANPAAFFENVQAGIRSAAEAEEKAKQQAAAEKKRLAYQFKAKYSAAARIEKFMQEIDASINNPPQPTGFSKLDAILDGGLYSGYAIVTGGTSVGKTSLCLQIADNIAASGRDILYFTLEMTAFDLMARSISRLTSVFCEVESEAKTTRYITDGTKRAKYSRAEAALVERATLFYADNIAPRLCFVEPWQFGKDFLSTDDIKAVLEEYAQGAENGAQAPVVFVDYAQLLRPTDAEKGIDAKQNMSNNATVLYHISKQYNTPVVTITSQPRSEYGKQDSMNAGKESGDLEYSAEYLFRLQFPRATSNEDKGNPDTYEKKQKAKIPRTVQLAIMKNRSGITGKTVVFEYDPRFNSFIEKNIAED